MEKDGESCPFLFVSGNGIELTNCIKILDYMRFNSSQLVYFFCSFFCFLNRSKSCQTLVRTMNPHLLKLILELFKIFLS